MNTIIVMKELFSRLVPELSRRLKSEGIRTDSRVKIISEYGEVVLNIKGYEVEIGEGKADIAFSLDRNSTTRLIYGIENFANQLCRGKIEWFTSKIPLRQAIGLLNTLFPKLEWYIWQADHW